MPKLKNLILIISISIFLFYECSDEINSPDESILSKDFSEIAQKLEQAYQNGSQSLLDTVFMAWQQTVQPYSHDEISDLSDTVQQVYYVFQAFYTPTDLDRITGGEHENFETDFRYIVLQNNLYFAVADTNPQYYYYYGVTTWEGNIPDFRPTPNESIFPFVYLTSQADSMIYQYLYKLDGTRKDDHEQRVTFLRKAMQLTHHHWISDYHKATMPIVSHIYLNEMLTQALVTFRVFYQFGEAYFERSNNNWVLIYSKLTGIE